MAIKAIVIAIKIKKTTKASLKEIISEDRGLSLKGLQYLVNSLSFPNLSIFLSTRSLSTIPASNPNKPMKNTVITNGKEK